jgi:hypothetical protein
MASLGLGWLKSPSCIPMPFEKRQLTIYRNAADMHVSLAMGLVFRRQGQQEPIQKF